MIEGIECGSERRGGSEVVGWRKRSIRRVGGTSGGAGRLVGVAACAAVVSAVALLGAESVAAQDGYEPVVSDEGTRSFPIGAIDVKVLVEESVLGGDEIEIVEMTFPPGGPTSGGQHRHGRVEIFYVLSGVLEHEVDGEAHRLEPGMVGIVRPEDSVAHRVLSEEPVRTLVIWAPGGELARFDRSGGGEG